MNMLFREAKSADILQIQVVRNAVIENNLSDPALVSDNDVHEFITNRGKGWVCEINENIVGFAIADLKDNNIWALFVHPDHEKKSIGKTLHDIMMNWYFEAQRSQRRRRVYARRPFEQSRLEATFPFPLVAAPARLHQVPPGRPSCFGRELSPIEVAAWRQKAERSRLR
jgi:hypothetical protein